MFLRVREFGRRHRYKLVAAAALAGGAYLLRYFAERQLRQWAEAESARMLDKVKKQAHFESTRTTCAGSLAQLTPRLLAQLTQLLDTDGPLASLRSGAGGKLRVWADLKRLALQRLLASVYGAAYLAVLLHVHVHALGGCLYVDSVRRQLAPAHETELQPLDEAAQERYLAGIERLLTVGVARLTRALVPLLAPLADGLALTERLGLDGVEALLWRALELLEHEPALRLAAIVAPDDEDSGSAAPAVDQAPLQSRQAQLTAETRDLLDSAETDAVVRQCTRAGLAHVLDQLVPTFAGQGGGEAGFVAPRAAALPVVRLVPVLSNLPHTLLRATGADTLPWLMANHVKLQVLAANVYESFSEVSL